MKKYLKIALVYLIVALVAGVYYREFSKAFGQVHTYSTLGLVHPHLLILGVLFVIMIGFLNEKFNKENSKLNKIMFIIYLVGISGAALLMLVRGTLNILIDSGTISDLSSGMSSMLSGISGCFHIAVGVGIISLFVTYLLKDKE